MSEYWSETSEDIKRVVKSIENRQRYIRRKWMNGDMTKAEHVREIEKLEARLDSVERLCR